MFSLPPATAAAFILGLLLAGTPAGQPPAAWAATDSTLTGSPQALSDTLEFVPFQADSQHLTAHPVESVETLLSGDGRAYRPYGDDLLSDPREWDRRHRRHGAVDVLADYNRVDQLRFGVGFQAQSPGTLNPRIGMRVEYAWGRERGLYGVQFEQPLLTDGRLAIGVSMSRRTDHNELHQVRDFENSLALLFNRMDYRDYFEREGYGGYLSSRVGRLSTVSVHLRGDQYRSLQTIHGTTSLLYTGRELRDNPPVIEGRAQTLLVRLEEPSYQPRRTRPGVYHWVQYERSGGQLGGDFDYSRILADLRSVVRLSPATSLALRLAGGSTVQGALPSQREFTVGGVDGLRAHQFAYFRGNQLALVQAEYIVGLWQLRTEVFDGGLHAMVFVDAGRAWDNPGHEWDLSGQKMAVDGGFGLSSSDDNLRVYFAKNLQDLDSDFIVSLRLQRPF